MDDYCLGTVVRAAIIHRHFILEILIRLLEVYAILCSLCSRAIDVDCLFLTRIETFFLLQTKCQNLIIAFQKLTIRDALADGLDGTLAEEQSVRWAFARLVGGGAALCSILNSTSSRIER